MIITKEELDRFHQFASSRIAEEKSGVTWRQLFEWWRLDNPSSAQLNEDVEAIRQSLDAMASGQTRPWEEFSAEFQVRNQVFTDKT